MAKELVKEYFSHDCGTRNDPDMIPLLDDFKAAGYGIYWSTVELLHERHGYLPLNENTYKAIAKPLGSKTSLVKDLIEKCISTYGLFYSEGDKFYSNRVLNNLEIRKKSTEQKVNAGKASAAKRKRPFNEASTTVQQNSTKKERKERKEESDLASTFGIQSVKAPKEQEVIEAFARMGGTSEQAKKFFDKYEAIGWKIKGSPIYKWTSLIRSFLDTWSEIRKENGETPGDQQKPKMIYA